MKKIHSIVKKIIIIFLASAVLLMAALILLPPQPELSRDGVSFDFKQVSQAESDKIVAFMEVKFIKNKPREHGIKSFDISSNGLIAIACDPFYMDKTVCVYDQNANFLYGYELGSPRSIHSVSWVEEKLVICSLDGDAIFLDSNGNVLGVCFVQNWSEIENTLKHATVKTVGEYQYVASNDGMGVLSFFNDSYCKLYKRDDVGTEVVIYDVTLQKIIVTIISVVVICGIFAIGIVFAIKAAKKYSTNKQ